MECTNVDFVHVRNISFDSLIVTQKDEGCDKMNNETRRRCLSLLERTEYYDEEGEWRIAGSDWLLLSGSTLRTWAKVTKQILGSGADAVMYMVGKYAGEQFAKKLLELGLKNEELEEALEIFLSNGGWGKARVKVNLQNQTAAVRIRNSVSTRQTKSEEPVCHFISGYIAGSLSVIFGKKTECVETGCKAAGEPFCEFSVENLAHTKTDNLEKVEETIANSQGQHLAVANQVNAGAST